MVNGWRATYRSRVSFGKLQLIQGLVDLQNGINRALLLSGHVGGHVDHRHEVLVIDGFFRQILLDPNNLPQGTRFPLPAHDPHGFQILTLDRSSRGKRSWMETSSFSLGWWRRPASIPESQTKGLGHLLGRYPVQRRFLFVHHETVFGLIILHVPVHIHDPLGLFKNVPDLAGHLDLAGIIRPINLGHQGLQNRRPRRNFGHLDSGLVPGGDGFDQGANPLGDVVALRLPFPLGGQVDLNVGHIGTPPQKIVAHQAVEVVRRGRADVHLVIGHLRNRADDVPDLPGQGRGLFQGRILRHVDDHLKLALVVEGQHLHPHKFDRQEGHGPQKKNHDQEEKSIAPEGFLDQGSHGPAVKPGGPALPSVALPLPG